MNILLGMSGGVDSSYAVKLLRDAGHNVEGAVIRMHKYTDLTAAAVSAAELKVALHIIDARSDFEREVVEPFTDEYLAARTPNPCIFCNPRVKFAALYSFAASHGFDKISTGHWCGIGNEEGRFFIRANPTKDQSYMLWGLTQAQLSALLFPLFGLEKPSIVADSRGMGLTAADRAESQEICFIPDGDYASFIEARRGKMPEGDFIAPDGSVAGRHKGILHYTIGQRKRLGIALGRPIFISKIEPETNRVYLADSGGEFSESMTVSRLNFQLLPPSEEAALNCSVKVRYAAKPVPCEVEIKNGRAYVQFGSPARAVTPGQSAVFYRGDAILFGGIIE